MANIKNPNASAQRWLAKNDPDWQWSSMPEDTDFVGAVRDNLATFGRDPEMWGERILAAVDARKAKP